MAFPRPRLKQEAKMSLHKKPTPVRIYERDIKVACLVTFFYTILLILLFHFSLI